MDTNNNASVFSPKEMTQIAERAGYYKISKSPLTTCYSAIVAGIFIAIAFAFYTTVTVGVQDVPYGLAKLVGGICFSLGLMLVVVCGNDLFTSTILTFLPKLTQKITWTQMFKNWTLVYVGNFIGGLLFVAVVFLAGQTMVANGQWGLNVLNIAQHKLHHTFTEALFLGFLANLLVCLAVWMSYAGRTLVDKAFIMILPVAMFVASGFEHSIANMFMIPMGIVIKHFAAPEFWTAIGHIPADFDQLTIVHFLQDNLLPVTLGNILGGLAVAIVYWRLHLHNSNG